MKTWKTLVSLLAIAQLSCAAEPGNVFEVVRLLDASATCQYDLGDNTFPSRVTFDAASVGASFVGFGLRNHMSTADTQTVETAEGISLRSQVNTLTLKGFEICITLAVPNEIDPVDCASIDGSAALQAKQFYRTTSVIPPAPDLSGGEINAAAMIKLFDSDTLASLFGNEFNAGSLRDLVVRKYQSTAAANNTAANCAGNSTSDAGVKAIRYGLGNGCDFGTAGSAPIGLFNSDVPQNTSSREFMIQVTAIANNAAGSEIRSSTFRFPATICIGCNQSDAQSSEGLSCPGISACDENDPDKGFEGFQPAIEKSYCYPATRQGALEKDHTKVFTCEKLECE